MRLIWEELTSGNVVRFCPLFPNLILQWLEERGERGNLHILSQQMQRQKQLLELKAHVHSTWSQYLALCLPTKTGHTHHRVHWVADTKRCASCNSVSQNWNRVLSNSYLWKLGRARHLVTTSHARLIVQHRAALNTFLISLVLLGRVKFSLGLKDLHKQNFPTDLASRPGPPSFDPIPQLFLPSNLGAQCLCYHML